MTDKAKIQVTFVENLDLIAQFDKMAEREGVTRADILRRAVRVFLASSPDNGSQYIHRNSTSH